MSAHHRGVVVQVLVLGMLVSCRAQVLQAQRPAPTAPDALGPPLIAALNGHDFASFEGLLHSRTRACLTTQTRPYFDAIFARQTRRPLAPSAEVRVTPLPSDRAPASDGLSPYPIRPTHQLQLELAGETAPRGVLLVLVALDHDQWRQVLACPSPPALARLEASRVADSTREARGRALAAQMPDSVRAEVLRLARAGRRIDAIQYYMRVSHEELAVAKQVVDVLLPPR